MESDIAYKRQHEAYMSNNNGSTPLESVLVITPTLLSASLVTGLRSLVPVSPHGIDSFGLSAFFLEYCSIVLPTILSFTVLSDHIVEIIVTVATFSCVTLSMGIAVGRKNLSAITVNLLMGQYIPSFLSHNIINRRRPYITNVRALTNLVTVLCILAVDFKVFPRRFAKTETYGYGIMDIGTGMFVVVNALVDPITRDGISNRETISRMVISNVPLGILGLLRVVALRSLAYHHHLTEYGNDWNFFLTLMVTRVICSLVMKFVKRSILCYILLSVIIIGGYELLLLNGLSNWIFSEAPRIDFITANREGLASVTGYIALYFGGVALGRSLNRWDKFTGYSNMVLTMKLTCLTCFLWSCTIFCESTLGVSRRLCNLGYFLWILSITTTLLSVLIASESFALLAKVVLGGNNEVDIVFVPTIAEAINYNGLLFFLLGNLLTGLINLCIKTLLLGSVSSVLIIMAYMLISCLFVVIMLKKRIHL